MPELRKDKMPRSKPSQPILSRTVPNADLFHTLNYMYQRAYHLEARAALTGRPHIAQGNPATMRHVFALARRAVLRMYAHSSPSDPAIKHSVCKKCFHVLIAGLTCQTSVQGAWRTDPDTRRARLVTSQCTHCYHVRARPVPHRLPVHKPKHLSQRQRKRRWLRRIHHPAPAPPHVMVPYAERMAGTPWQEPLLAYAKAHNGDIKSLQHALECRGGHIVTVGLGRNGSIGPTVDDRGVQHPA